jgi:hypothetical protein
MGRATSTPSATRTARSGLRSIIFEVELKDAQERIAFLTQELDRVRQKVPRGPSTS